MSLRATLAVAIAAAAAIPLALSIAVTHAPPAPTTTISSCASSTLQYPSVASGFDLHHVCGTQCSAEYPICECVQYDLYSWYCGPDPYDTDASTYYGCCQDWGNGTYGCFCDGTPGAP